MGMADARDRTVATNYLRETIEDFKNMDFNQVKSEPIILIPDTKFSRGAYVLNLEEIDGVVTLKKVITQVRWIDRKGNIKTEKASTILYKKPATSEVGDNAIEIVLYALSYYTILPEKTINLIAEIKDENGNIYDCGEPITFSVITEPPNDPQVGNITTSQPVSATNGVANCIYTAISGVNVEGIERIEAAATVDGKYLTDTVNIRITTGPVGILLVPKPEEDKIPAGIGNTSTINLTVVKADYEESIEYDKPITLSAVGPGTLSETTIGSVDTDGVEFYITSNGTPGVVEITASAPDLDIGYTEITFTGEPTSIIITPAKKSIYPGEDIGITVTIVDVNNVPVSFNEEVNLSALPSSYGSFNDDSLSFTGQSSLDTTVFTADSDAPPGETITIQANSGSISGSAEITILSLLIPKYLELFPISQSVDLNGTDEPPTITATVTDVSGATVTTYSTPIIFEAKDKYGVHFGSFPSSNPETQDPIEGEVNIAFDTSDISGTATITASSGDLLLRPEGGIEIVFYGTAHHIVLSAEPTIIEADGDQTSIITAIVCDAGGNKVANYVGYITFETNLGIFPDSSDVNITVNDFDEGEVWVELSSNSIGEATVNATATSDEGVEITTEAGGELQVSFTGDILSVLALGEVTNQDDYLITFNINVTGSSFILEEIKVEWDNSSAPLDLIVIRSPSNEEGLTKSTEVSDSPSTLTEVGKTLIKDVTSNIGLSFTYGVSKMKQKNITVTFTEYDGTPHVVSFKVPNV
ncbi:hypothetical protein ES704_03473 [subsurface metagenome]